MTDTTRTEYRVVGTERRTGHEWLGEPRVKEPHPWQLSSLRARNDDVRIQSRTVTESPWTDLPEQEEGSG